MPTKTTSPDALQRRVAREIARRNRVFTAASPAQRRVLLAKDVIAQINAGLFVPMTGNWADMNLPYSHIPGPTASLQEVLLKDEGIQCDTCALGSLMVSCVLFKNRIKVDDLDSQGCLNYAKDGKISDPTGLADHFTKEQLKLIEMAFEGSHGFYADHTMTERERNAGDAWVDAEFTVIEKRAMRWYASYGDDERRLLAIMRNVIRNRGTFVP